MTSSGSGPRDDRPGRRAIWVSSAARSPGLPAMKARLTARKSALLNQLEAEIDLCAEIRRGWMRRLADECPLASRDGGFIRDGFHADRWTPSANWPPAASNGSPATRPTSRGRASPRSRSASTRSSATTSKSPTRTREDPRRLHPQADGEERRALHHAGAEGVRGKGPHGRREARNWSTICSWNFARPRRLRRRMQATADVLAQLDVLGLLAELARQRNYCRPEASRSRSCALSTGGIRCWTHRPRARSCPTTFARRTRRRERARTPISGGRSADHRPEHGRQEHVHSPGGADDADGADRQFRAGPRGRDRRGRPHFRPRRGQRRVGPRTEHVHGRDDRDGADSEYGHAAEPGDSRRDRPRHEHVRRHFAGLGVVEYLHDHIGCRTLFATHYHELTDLEKSLGGVKNLNVAVREWQEEVIFLHKIVPGAADKSYGIHVARLAGVPKEVNRRAMEILARLEQEHLSGDEQPKLSRRRERSNGELQLTLFAPQEHPVLDRIRELELDNTTPLEAMRLLQEWQSALMENKPINLRGNLLCATEGIVVGHAVVACQAEFSPRPADVARQHVRFVGNRIGVNPVGELLIEHDVVAFASRPIFLDSKAP